jgi:NAD+ diphosphatase
MLAFTADPLDRAAARRTDSAFLAAALGDPGSRAVLVGAEGPLLDARGGAALVPVADALGGGAGPEPLFLGLQGGRAIFALEVPAGLAPGVAPAGARFASLRDAAATMAAPDAGLLAHACALAGWHRAHPFCARCGSPTVSEEGGHLRRCLAHGHPHHPRTDPVVIMLVTDGDRALLGRQPRWPPGRFSCLAGFVEPGETLESAVRREVREEAGVEVSHIVYRISQPWPFPASLMLAFRARWAGGEPRTGDDELEQVGWFELEELAQALRAGADTTWGAGVEGGGGRVLLPGRQAVARHLIAEWVRARTRAARRDEREVAGRQGGR